ncbi:5-guanidino-2-oxopentanoate decarboxylase [Dasania marina]|uniref:5-guanidino-2-oxopentanoate decarboxylase n=1 Tax=Dasania marina TaxID=471499 RepID=UPI0030DC5327|tara:strand:+ start:22057 stop:23673 length:1617 start_codon:yes stop_codon:yes gene_type:complete
MKANSISPMTCGQALVKLLEAYQVDTVFGIPGVHTLELYRGLPGRNIRHILSRHEQGAGFMADGYARVTGKPGVCFVISGPGLTNITTPIGQAYSDSIPMLVISSVNETRSLGKGWGRLHETKNQRAITEPLTAFSATALQINDIPDLIARAFSVFNSERPRPVHIEIPMDILAAPIDVDWTADVRVQAQRPRAEYAAINAAAKLLGEAQKPLIIAGGGAIGANDDIAALAETLNATVFSTVAGKGILPAQHPLNAGSNLCMPQAWDYIENADVILAIGTELSDTDKWRDKLPIKGSLIRVDIDPRKLNDLYPATLPILSDARAFAQAVKNALPNKTAGLSPAVAVQQLKQTIAESQPELQRKHMAVLDMLKHQLPTNAIIATDMTQIAYTGNYYYAVNNTRSWLHPTGYGTLGYGLPAGIGAKIGAPERVAVVLAGDGGFLYTLQELATATEELHSPFIVILWNNDSLGQIRDDMIDLDIPPIGVCPKNPDFIKVAAGFGCFTMQPKSWDELSNSLQVALEHQGVSFIEVHQQYFDL